MFWKIATGVLALLLLTFMFFAWSQPLALPATGPYSNWSTYTSDDGFSFQYPPGYTVNATADPEEPARVIVHVVATDREGPPAMQITYAHDAWVTFALWEGIPWDGYAGVTESFTFTRATNE